jgi:hypothetical protein
MKRILPFLSIAVVLAACSNNAKTNTDAVASVTEQAQALKVDTTGLAEFQNWKLQQQIAEIQTPAQPAVQYAAAAPVKKAKKTYRPAAKVVEQAPPAVSSPATESSTNNGEDVAMSSESTNAAEAPEKKGWSKAAKGAAIGGATGAAAGAVINKKNRAVGAVIGGVLGAGGGYVIGRGMDKKDGRY